MQGINFRITEANAVWTWRNIGPDGLQIDGGSAANRAEAAAMVIRSIVRSETGDVGPALAMASAA